MTDSETPTLACKAVGLFPETIAELTAPNLDGITGDVICRVADTGLTIANCNYDTTRHLTPAELAARWRVSPRTLERWRVNGIGPCWLKLCGRVVYRQEDVDLFEAGALHGPRNR